MYNLKYKMKNIHGFTLAEILTVITILVVLALAMLTTINPLTQFLKGFDTVRRDDLKKIRIAYENYYADHDCYPPKDTLTHCGGNNLDPYLSSIPCDPNDNTPYSVYMGNDNETCPQRFAIYASFTNKKDAKSDTISLCPDKMVVSSTMTNFDIIDGCSSRRVCPTPMFDCRNVLVSCRRRYCPVLFTNFCSQNCV
jgi:prepilin-type N-terminal cleavage/methylation domain-containing protein